MSNMIRIEITDKNFDISFNKIPKEKKDFMITKLIRVQNISERLSDIIKDGANGPVKEIHRETISCCSKMKTLINDIHNVLKTIENEEKEKKEKYK